jgi:hypothetical protein
MGINRWSGGREDRKRNETDAKAGDEVPEEKKGTPPPEWRPPRNRPRTRRSAGYARSSRSGKNRAPRLSGLPPSFASLLSRDV